MKRNNIISFWRIIFTYTIIIFHLLNQYGLSSGLGIGVEFFFVVSGWLLAVDLEEKNLNPYEYTWHRICRLYPDYFLAFIVSVICYIHFHNYSMIDTIKWFFDKGYKELLMIHYWPWEDSYAIANIPTWYISVMIISGLLLYSLGKRCQNVLNEIIIPIVIVIFLSYSYLNIGDITVDRIDFDGLLHMNFLRGFSEMGLGMLLYKLNKCVLSTHYITTTIKVIGFFTLSFVLVSAYIVGGGVYTYLYFWLIAIGVFISFNTNLPHLNKYVEFFEKISYNVFLNHIIFRSYIIPLFFHELTPICMMTYIILVTLFSITMFYLRRVNHFFYVILSKR